MVSAKLKVLEVRERERERVTIYELSKKWTADQLGVFLPLT